MSLRLGVVFGEMRGPENTAPPVKLDRMHPLMKEVVETCIECREWAVNLITKKNGLLRQYDALRASLGGEPLDESQSDYINSWAQRGFTPEQAFDVINKRYFPLRDKVEQAKRSLPKLEEQLHYLNWHLTDTDPHSFPPDSLQQFLRLTKDRDERLRLLSEGIRKNRDATKGRRVDLKLALQRAEKRSEESEQERIRKELDQIDDHSATAEKLAGDLSDIIADYHAGIALIQVQSATPRSTDVRSQMIVAHRDQCLQEVELAFQKETESIKKRKVSIIRELAEAKQAVDQDLVVDFLKQEFKSIKGMEERIRDKEQARQAIFDRAAERLAEIE